MALKLISQKNGPDVPEEAKTKRFRSYVDFANWAESVSLANGSYYIYPAPHPSFSNMREVRVKWDGLGVWVEGRGNI